METIREYVSQFVASNPTLCVIALIILFLTIFGGQAVRDLAGSVNEAKEAKQAQIERILTGQ